METCTLENGLRVIHQPLKSNVVYCGLAVAAGTRDELPGEEGLAHFVEHMTFKGTQRRTAMQIINQLEGVGGELNAFTNKEDTVYYAVISHEHLGRAIDVLTDIVFNSQYPQAEIDKEVEVICEEIESYNDTPSELIFDEFENLLFEGHPLGHNILGTAERLHTFKTTDALRFTRRHYRPERMVFFAYGDVEFSKLVKMINRSLSPLGDGRPDGARTAQTDDKPQNNSSSPQMLLPQGGAGTEVLRSLGTHQAHVMLGTRAYHAHHPLRMALYLLNNMLGGPGMNARLNLSLRERHGLVYTVESTMVSYADTGLWAVYFGCDQKDVNRCLRLVRRCLDGFMEKPLSPTRLAAAKRQIKGQLAIACDNHEQFALDIAKSYLHHGAERNLEQLYRRIDAVTADEIQQVARELFDPQQLTTLIYK